MPAQLPIRVRASSVPATAASAARTIFSGLVIFALGKGWIAPDDVQGLTLIAGAVISMIWGPAKVSQRHRKLVTAASAAPDAIAQVK